MKMNRSKFIAFVLPALCLCASALFADPVALNPENINSTIEPQLMPQPKPQPQPQPQPQPHPQPPKPN